MKRHYALATAGTIVALLLLSAAGDVRLERGLWRVRTTPGVATLDGKPLEDLPIAPITSETICVTEADAADPARFFARDMDGCTAAKATVSRGKVEIAGTCPSQDGDTPSSYRLSGHFDGAAYDVSFATTAFGANGRMGFSGRTVGARLGGCPPA